MRFLMLPVVVPVCVLEGDGCRDVGLLTWECGRELLVFLGLDVASLGHEEEL